MKRTVIKIDESLCNGCGLCVKGCHEGALQLINGKAVLVSDLYCDGLGACIGDCPEKAISFEEREAEAYDENAVMDRIVPKGIKAIQAHLKHLKDHGEVSLFKQGMAYLKEHGISVPTPVATAFKMAPSVKRDTTFSSVSIKGGGSELRQFPVQLHLLNPGAGFLQQADLLLAADCSAFAVGDFHDRFLKGKALAIACPKLDSRLEVYVEKLAVMIDEAAINTLTVLIMEVPCCGGLLKIAQAAQQRAQRRVPIKLVVLSIKGDVIREEWLPA